MLSFLENRKLVKDSSEKLFIKLNEYARNPIYYNLNDEDHKVNDDPDGRFELIALFATSIFNANINKGEFHQKISQTLFDKIFKTFDRALREFGVSDMKVGKSIRKIAENFYGRQLSYSPLIFNNDIDSLAVKIALNIFSRIDEIKEIDLKLANDAIEFYKELNQTDM